MPCRLRRLSALVAAAVLLAGCAATDGGLDVHAVEDATAPPPDAELADAGWPEAAAWIEREVDAGRPVVVNIFASWCTPCRRELPLLIEAADANPDIAFLGVDHQDLREQGTRFVDEQEIDFPTLYDPAGDIAVAVGARGMPTTAFFDASGRLVRTHTGELNRQLLDDALAGLAPRARS